MVLQKILGFLVLLVLCVNADADKDIHQYFFTVNGTSTVSVLLINHSLCTYPGMKLNYHPNVSNTDGVGELVYNEVYKPYKVVALNTKKYSIDNITTERNNSFLIVHFDGISALAFGGVFSIHQICGVTQLVHENEYWFKFISVYPTSANSTSTSTIANKKPTEDVAPGITTCTNSTPKAGNETGAEKVLIGAIIAGIVVFLLLIVGLFAFCKPVHKFFCRKRRGSIELETR